MNVDPNVPIKYALIMFYPLLLSHSSLKKFGIFELNYAASSAVTAVIPSDLI